MELIHPELLTTSRAVNRTEADDPDVQRAQLDYRDVLRDYTVAYNAFTNSQYSDRLERRERAEQALREVHGAVPAHWTRVSGSASLGKAARSSLITWHNLIQDKFMSVGLERNVDPSVPPPQGGASLQVPYLPKPQQPKPQQQPRMPVGLEFLSEEQPPRRPTLPESATGPRRGPAASYNVGGQLERPPQRSVEPRYLAPAPAPAPVTQAATRTVPMVDLTSSHNPNTIITLYQEGVVTIDTTGERPRVVTYSQTGQLEVRHPQVYDPELDKRFPFRDPDNPANVHPDYAHDNDARRVHRNVEIGDVRLSEAELSQMWGLFGQEARRFLWHQYGSPSERAARQVFGEQTEQRVREEFAATLGNQAPPSTKLYEVIKLTEEHCPKGLTQLVGQYGVVTRRGTQLAPGQVIGVFAGAKLSEMTDESKYLAAIGPEERQKLHDYSFEIKRSAKEGPLTLAPYGGGNHLQYCNSSFKERGDGTLDVDRRQTNASMQKVTVELKNKWGVWNFEKAIFAIQHGKGVQVILDYGGQYRLSQERPPAHAPAVKPEPHERLLSPETERSVPSRLMSPVSRLSPGAASAGAINARVVARGVIQDDPAEDTDPRSLEFRRAEEAAIEAGASIARQNLKSEGREIAPNDGSGLNCLIFSLLQHARQDYRNPGQAMRNEAEVIRSELRLGEGMLLPDNRDFLRLLQRINRDLPAQQMMQVQFNVPDSQGELDGLIYGGDNPRLVHVLQRSRHYEAIYTPPVQRQPLDAAAVAGPSTDPQPTPAPYTQQLQPAQARAIETGVAITRQTLERHGRALASNGRNGAESLMFALLQHVRNEYSMPDQAMKDEVKLLSGKLLLGEEMLFPYHPRFSEVLNQINSDLPPSEKLCVEFGTPNAKGELISVTLGQGNPRPVRVLVGAERYHAVYKSRQHVATTSATPTQDPRVSVAPAAPAAPAAPSRATGSMPLGLSSFMPPKESYASIFAESVGAAVHSNAIAQVLAEMGRYGLFLKQEGGHEDRLERSRQFEIRICELLGPCFRSIHAHYGRHANVGASSNIPPNLLSWMWQLEIAYRKLSGGSPIADIQGDSPSDQHRGRQRTFDDRDSSGSGSGSDPNKPPEPAPTAQRDTQRVLGAKYFKIPSESKTSINNATTKDTDYSRKLKEILTKIKEYEAFSLRAREVEKETWGPEFESKICNLIEPFFLSMESHFNRPGRNGGKEGSTTDTYRNLLKWMQYIEGEVFPELGRDSFVARIQNEVMQGNAFQIEQAMLPPELRQEGRQEGRQAGRGESRRQRLRLEWQPLLLPEGQDTPPHRDGGGGGYPRAGDAWRGSPDGRQTHGHRR
jgi:hypothetical protein